VLEHLGKAMLAVTVQVLGKSNHKRQVVVVALVRLAQMRLVLRLAVMEVLEHHLIRLGVLLHQQDKMFQELVTMLVAVVVRLTLDQELVEMVAAVMAVAILVLLQLLILVVALETEELVVQEL
jgi:hypothetical protein